MNVAKFNVHGQELNVEDSSARQTIGNLTELETTNKNNLVEAINEVKNNKNYGMYINQNIILNGKKTKINQIFIFYIQNTKKRCNLDWLHL